MELYKVLIIFSILFPLDTSEFVKSTSDYIPVCERYDRSLDFSSGRFKTTSPSFAYPPFICVNLAGNNVPHFPLKKTTEELEYLNLAGGKIPVALLSSYEHPTVKILVLDEAIAGLPNPRKSSLMSTSSDIVSENSNSREREYMTDSVKISLKLPHLKELYLRNNNLTSVWIPSWSDTPEITHLYMNKNNVTSTNFLSNFPKKLTHLYLDRNALRTFKTGSLKNLQVLHLDHNPLGSICRKVNCQGIWLRGAINLQELSLSSADISTFEDDAMEHLTSLKYLDLSDNKLSKIPERAFSNLTSLVVIKLNQNNLMDIPSLLYSKNLEEANFSHNEIRYISHQTFHNTTNLKHLDLSHNRIAEVTHGVFDMLPLLMSLNLSWNKVTELHRDWFTSRTDRSDGEESLKLADLDLSNNGLRKLSNWAFLHLTNLVVLKLNSNELQNIPHLCSLTKLEELNVNRNALRGVGKKTFCFVKNLKKIDLSRNEITKVTPGAFYSLSSLTILDLSWNKLIQLPQNLFISENDGRSLQTPLKLQHLDLSNNKLKIIATLAFQNLTSLVVLKLNHNLLLDIPSLCNLEKIKILDLSYNALKNISEQTFCTLKYLEHFNVSHNEITQITPGVFHMLGSLKRLDLSWNKLKRFWLPWFLSGNLIKLESLNLSNNIFRRIPRRAFENLTGLVALKLNNNALKDLPNLCYVRKLQTLNLSHNVFYNVSSNTFCKLTHLTHLDLSRNKIGKITPGAFDMMPLLKTLDLSWNKIQKLEINWWISQDNSELSGDSMKLQYLDLSSNDLQTIPEQLFPNLTSLLTLKLGRNGLQHIPDLCNLRQLRELNLSRNGIQNISQQTFCSLKNLKYIDLSYNQITMMTPGVITTLPSLTALDLSWNEFNGCTEFDDLETIENLRYLNLAGNQLQFKFLSYFAHATVQTLVLDEVIFGIQHSKSACQNHSLINSKKRSLGTYNPKFSAIIPQLRQLYLRKNNLESLRVTRWSYICPEITHLYLSHNQFTSANFLSIVPEKLTHLYLDKNHLQTFRIGSLENLTVLNLDYNPLGYVCEKEYCHQGIQLRDAINLQKLSLSSANLSTLEENAMKDLISLKYLDLSSNRLSKIPEGAFKHLTNLTVLKLTDNLLADVPDIRYLINLKKANFSHNSIHAISSKTFHNLTNLKNLDLSHNKITVVAPEAFSLLTSLKTLNISWNQLTVLPQYWFLSGISAVPKILKLEHNVLTDIPNLCDFENLEELDVSHNAIKSIKQKTFCNLKYLKKINLSHNNIFEIEIGGLQFLPSLTQLDVSWNKFRTFPLRRVSRKNYLANMLSVSISGNPLESIRLIKKKGLL